MILNSIDNLITITENASTEAAEQIAKTGLRGLGSNIHTALSNALTGFKYNKKMKLYDKQIELHRDGHDKHEAILNNYHNNEILPIQKNIEELKKSIENESSPSKRYQLEDDLDYLNKQLKQVETNHDKLRFNPYIIDKTPEYIHYKNYNSNKDLKELLNTKINKQSIRDSKSFKTGQFIANHEKAIGGATLTTGGVIGTTVNKVLHRKESKENDSSTDK